MNDNKKGFDNLKENIEEESVASNDLPKKGPLSFFTGSITSLLLSWISYVISKKIVFYFLNHQQDYSSPIAQSVASGFKTLIIGISFLATFSFGFIGLGLLIVFIKSLFQAKIPVDD